eukprot:gene12215-16365_t
MGKDKKERNPADQYRKELRKQEIKKNKKDKQVINEVRKLLDDPEKIEEEISKYQKLSDENKLDKSLKDKIKEFKLMKEVAKKKLLIKQASGKEITKPTNTITSNNEDKLNISRNSYDVMEPKSALVDKRAENSIYYHPIYNPSGAPPEGQSEQYHNSRTITSTIAEQSNPSNTAILANPLLGMVLPSGVFSPPPPPPPVAPALRVPNINPGVNNRQIAIGGLNGIPLPPPRPQVFSNPNIPSDPSKMIPIPIHPNNIPFNPNDTLQIMMPPPPPIPPIHLIPLKPPQLSSVFPSYLLSNNNFVPTTHNNYNNNQPVVPIIPIIPINNSITNNNNFPKYNVIPGTNNGAVHNEQSQINHNVSRHQT